MWIASGFLNAHFYQWMQLQEEITRSETHREIERGREHNTWACSNLNGRREKNSRKTANPI